MNETKKIKESVTIISRSPPYGRDNAFTCLDLALAYSVFDKKVNYLFIGQGVLQLTANQQPEHIDSKNLAAALGALEVYGVEHVFVDKQALEKFNLRVADLVIKPQVLDDVQLRQIVNASATVYTL
jgi:tRNA 2-thiouridine synthesizing protein C